MLLAPEKSAGKDFQAIICSKLATRQQVKTMAYILRVGQDPNGESNCSSVDSVNARLHPGW